MQTNRSELKIDLIYQIAYYQTFQKGNLSVEQFINYRGLTKVQIERFTNKYIADKTHAKLIAINLPNIYWLIIKNLKNITTEKVTIIAKLIEGNNETEAADLIRIFNAATNNCNWQNRR
jgi:DUF917 family protein